jgi:outer membrane lipoprotein-sorting protein
MRLGIKIAFAALLVLNLPPLRAAAPTDAEKDRLLRRLDAAALNFRSTSADLVAVTEQTDPVPDMDTQKAVVYYQRDGKVFKMAAHIHEANGKPVANAYTFSGGKLEYFEHASNQITRFARAGQYESYAMLGFGASGKELEEMWEIKYLGPETIGSVKTEKLELIAKDPEVRKNVAKVTVWLDPDRAVSLRQRFDQRNSYRICTYSNFKINQPLPKDAFSFKTDPNPTYVNR